MKKTFGTVLACLCLFFVLPVTAADAPEPVIDEGVEQAVHNAAEAQPQWVLFDSVLSRALAAEKGADSQQSAIPPYNCTANPCEDCDQERNCCMQNWCQSGDFSCIRECYMRYRECVFTCGG